MDHLIVVAHPLIDSVTMKLARAYSQELKKLRHQPRMHDLYRMGFNPVLTAAELEPLRKGRETPSDIASPGSRCVSRRAHRDLSAVVGRDARHAEGLCRSRIRTWVCLPG